MMFTRKLFRTLRQKASLTRRFSIIQKVVEARFDITEIETLENQLEAIHEERKEELEKRIDSSLNDIQKLKVDQVVDAIFQLDSLELLSFYRKQEEIQNAFKQVSPFAILENFPVAGEIEDGKWTNSEEGDLKTEKDNLISLFTNVDLIESLEIPLGFGGAGAGGDAVVEEEEEVEEQTAWDVQVTEVNKKGRIKVIRELKNILGLGLKDAKVMTESVPFAVKKGIPREEAEEIEAKFKELGCEVGLI